MADRHKRPPRAVRMPGNLEAWYEHEAKALGMKVNKLIVIALREYQIGLTEFQQDFAQRNAAIAPGPGRP